MISVITTIAQPTLCVKKLAAQLQLCQSRLVAVGDKKGPSSFEAEGVFFLSLEAQNLMPYELAKLLPTGHYARKNLGYLLAFEQCTPCIYETDDDNAPDHRWGMRQLTAPAKSIQRTGWVNVYKFFSDELIWPRGFPLDQIHNNYGDIDVFRIKDISVSAPIQQGLADLSPDVDAIWRLVCDRPFSFLPGPNIYLEPGSWCPFNSQNTWWWPEAYVLMYLPSFCSFRMTDIWRGFVAQRCLWAMGKGLLFYAADVIQERNEHNLQKDFEAEIPGYIGNDRLVKILEGSALDSEPEKAGNNLIACYEALIAANFFPEKELELVRAWVADVEVINSRLDHISTAPAK